MYNLPPWEAAENNRGFSSSRTLLNALQREVEACGAHQCGMPATKGLVHIEARRALACTKTPPEYAERSCSRHASAHCLALYGKMARCSD